MSTRTGRLDRVGCLMAEAEVEKLRRKCEKDDVTHVVLEVLEKYPEARAELLKRLEEAEHQGLEMEPEELAAISDDELERRARAILERRDRMRAEGKL